MGNTDPSRCSSVYDRLAGHRGVAFRAIVDEHD
jgi:hypothetical protein